MLEWPVDVKLNKYTTWYEKLVLTAKTRILPDELYFENHHIIPHCMTKDNSADNIVKLTAREHYIAHLLLWKMTMLPKWHNKMMMALHVMINGSGSKRQKQERASYRIPSRIFEANRKEWALHMSNSSKGENNHFYGKKHSEKTVEKIKEANRRTKDIRSEKLKGEKNPMWGKTHTDEVKKILSVKISAAWTDDRRRRKSEETALKWQNAEYRAHQNEKRKQRWESASEEERKRIGRKAAETKKANGNNRMSDEQKKKMSLARKGKPGHNKGIPAIRQVCPHCFKLVGGASNFIRWHNDNCKEKK